MSNEKKPIRVWVDGCFDMFHFGHANALRQAKLLGDYLIVGVHSDEEIKKHKGPPVLSEEERYKAVEACKWVDEIVRGAPYVTSLKMLNDYNVDFCAHGDDIVTTSDGVDTYYEVKAAGKFRTFHRTEGVSTTDLVGRMLLMTREHHRDASINQFDTKHLNSLSEGGSKHSPYTGVSHFLPTSRKIVQFSEGHEPKPDDRIVYVDGSFDLFHVGHIEILRKAKEFGTYLLVGVHDDQVINRIKGENYPIMNLHERVLSVLSCKYVDEVIIGAPYDISKEALISLNVSVVIHGSLESTLPVSSDLDPYKAAKELGIYRIVQSPSQLTAQIIIERIINNRLAFEARNAKKEQKELTELSKQKQ
jgi:ethanolamine-phosphate cytidylyltransferase